MHLDFKVKFFSFDLSFLSNLEVILRNSFPSDAENTLFGEALEGQKPGVIEMELIGPIRLPLKNKHYTVNRSPHLHKKSRDQFLFTRFSVLYVVKAKLDTNLSPEIKNKMEEKIQMYFFKVMRDIKQNNPINVTVSY